MPSAIDHTISQFCLVFRLDVHNTFVYQTNHSVYLFDTKVQSGICVLRFVIVGLYAISRYIGMWYKVTRLYTVVSFCGIFQRMYLILNDRTLEDAFTSTPAETSFDDNCFWKKYFPKFPRLCIQRTFKSRSDARCWSWQTVGFYGNKSLYGGDMTRMLPVVNMDQMNTSKLFH